MKTVTEFALSKFDTSQTPCPEFEGMADVMIPVIYIIPPRSEDENKELASIILWLLGLETV